MMEKNLSKSQKLDVILGILIEIFLFFPWIRTGEKGYNSLTYLYQCFKSGDCTEMYRHIFLAGSDKLLRDVETTSLCFAIGCIALVSLQILCLIYILSALKRKSFTKIPLFVSSMVILLVLMGFAQTEMKYYTITKTESADIIPGFVFVYFVIASLIGAVYFFIIKAAEEWDDASRYAKEEKEKKKEYQRERKKRLHFPGKYSKLYYRVLWKDFKYRWKDVAYIFACVFLSTVLLFIGISMRSIFAQSYGEDQGLLGLGLVEIMWDFLIVIILIVLFLLTAILVFYRKKRVANSGLFHVLGIRRNTYFVSWIAELILCILFSVILGVAIGSITLQVLRIALMYIFPNFGELGSPNILDYFWTFFGMFCICLFAYGFSHDIQAVKESEDARGVAAKGETIPDKYSYLGLCAGSIVAVWCLYRYTQRRTAESLLVLCIFLICGFVIVYNSWAIGLKYLQKNQKAYLRSLTDTHIVKYRYKTTVQYVSLFAIIHICVLFYFTMTIVSNKTATRAEELFPYDYVFLENSGDEEYIRELRSQCEGKVHTFPMIRVTTVDNTEEPDPPAKISYQQGQNIGVSETTYRKLKKLVGQNAEEELKLDAAGQNIYIVYQQDQGTKAKPLDWYMGTKQPYLHIGQPLTAYNAYEYEKYYPQRHIVGEETNSLIGCFKQGKYENVVVLSDAYFDKVKDEWKHIDMYTGEKLDPDEAVIEENIHEGPTILTLVNIQEKYLNKANKIMKKFQEKHAYDESFDPLVKSAYAKTEAVKQRQMERLIAITIAGVIWGVLFLISILIIHMKVKMELPEMKKRYRYMECFGMRQKERIRAEKKEISRLVMIPLALSVVTAFAFTIIIFNLRNFQMEDILKYGKGAGVLWGIYIFAQILNLRCLQHDVIQKVEKDIGK